MTLPRAVFRRLAIFVLFSPSKNNETASRRMRFLALGSLRDKAKSCLDFSKFNLVKVDKYQCVN